MSKINVTFRTAEEIAEQNKNKERLLMGCVSMWFIFARGWMFIANDRPTDRAKRVSDRVINFERKRKFGRPETDLFFFFSLRPKIKRGCRVHMTIKVSSVGKYVFFFNILGNFLTVFYLKNRWKLTYLKIRLALTNLFDFINSMKNLISLLSCVIMNCAMSVKFGTNIRVGWVTTTAPISLFGLDKISKTMFYINKTTVYLYVISKVFICMLFPKCLLKPLRLGIIGGFHKVTVLGYKSEVIGKNAQGQVFIWKSKVTRTSSRRNQEEIYTVNISTCKVGGLHITSLNISTRSYFILL